MYVNMASVLSQQTLLHVRTVVEGENSTKPAGAFEEDGKTIGEEVEDAHYRLAIFDKRV